MKRKGWEDMELIDSKAEIYDKNYFYHYLVEKDEVNKEKTAVVCGKHQYSYRELDKYIKEIACILKDFNVNKNSKVGLYLSNPLDFTILLLASVYCDGIIVPIYANTGEVKVKEIIHSFKVDFVITNKYLSGMLYKNIAINQRVYHVYQTDFTTEQLPMELVLLMQTSGTTSNPKGVMLSVKNIISNIDSIQDYLKLTTKDKSLIIKNVNHISTIVGEIFTCLHVGCSLIMNENMALVQNIVTMIGNNDITILFAVPAILHMMLQSGSKAFQQLRIVNFYGSSMPQEDILTLLNCFPNTNFIYSYGLTEASPRVSFIERDDLQKKPGSCGKAVKNVAIRILNQEDNELEPYEEGEVVVRGDNVMMGYYRNQEMTNHVLRNNELHTGDYGYIDEEGYLYVNGRRDNMMILAGKNIHPEEIESILLSFEGISDALVQMSEINKVPVMCAYIVSNNRETLDCVEIMQYCHRRLEDYKVPKNILQVKELKKTPSGKIIRNQIN